MASPNKNFGQNPHTPKPRTNKPRDRSISGGAFGLSDVGTSSNQNAYASLQFSQSPLIHPDFTGPSSHRITSEQQGQRNPDQQRSSSSGGRFFDSHTASPHARAPHFTENDRGGFDERLQHSINHGHPRYPDDDPYILPSIRAQLTSERQQGVKPSHSGPSGYTQPQMGSVPGSSASNYRHFGQSTNPFGRGVISIPIQAVGDRSSSNTVPGTQIWQGTPSKIYMNPPGPEPTSRGHPSARNPPSVKPSTQNGSPPKGPHLPQPLPQGERTAGLFASAQRDTSKQPDPSSKDANTTAQSAPIRLADPIENDTWIRSHPSDESKFPVLVHTIPISLNPATMVPFSSTGIIFLSLDTSFRTLFKEIDHLLHSGEFAAHRLESLREAPRVFSVRWSPNNRHDPQLPDSQLRNDLEVTKALRMMKARGWRDHLQSNYRFIQREEPPHPTSMEAESSVLHTNVPEVEKQTIQYDDKPANPQNSASNVSTGGEAQEQSGNETNNQLAEEKKRGRANSSEDESPNKRGRVSGSPPDIKIEVDDAEMTDEVRPDKKISGGTQSVSGEEAAMRGTSIGRPAPGSTSPPRSSSKTTEQQSKLAKGPAPETTSITAATTPLSTTLTKSSGSTPPGRATAAETPVSKAKSRSTPSLKTPVTGRKGVQRSEAHESSDRKMFGASDSDDSVEDLSDDHRSSAHKKPIKGEGPAAKPRKSVNESVKK